MSTGAESRVGWMAERWQPLAPGPRPPPGQPPPCSWPGPAGAAAPPPRCSAARPALPRVGARSPRLRKRLRGEGTQRLRPREDEGEPLGPGVLPTAGQGGVQCAHIPAWPKASPAAQEQKSADRRGGPWEALSLCCGMRWGQGLPACLGRCSPVSVWGARGGGGAPSSRRSGVCSWALGRNSTCMPAHTGHGWGRENKRAET